MADEKVNHFDTIAISRTVSVFKGRNCTNQEAFMSTLALTGTTRRWITRLHRWNGLFLLAFLMVDGITGGILSFRWEIDRAINPHLFSVAPQTESMPYKALIDVVERRFPDAIVSNVVVPKTSQDAAIVYIKSRMDAHVAHVHVPGMKSSVEFNQIFVNPHSGEILGQRSTTRFVPTWENFVPDIARLHLSLFLDEVGAWLMGVCAVVWFLTTLLGLVLTWPAAWRSLQSWKPLMSLRTDNGSYMLNYDLHRMASLVTLPILVVVAFTSIYMNMPNVVRPVVRAFSPLFDFAVVPSSGHMDLATPRVPVEQVIATARDTLPGARVHSVGQDFLKGLYSVRMQLPGDVSPTGNNTVFVRMTDGQVIFQRKIRDASGGDVFLAWQWPLHTGRAFGRLGQCLILVGAIALVIMCITGFNIWLRKRP